MNNNPRPSKRRRISPSFSPPFSQRSRNYRPSPHIAHKRSRREFGDDGSHQQPPSKRHKLNPFPPTPPEPPSHPHSVPSSATTDRRSATRSGPRRQFQGHSRALSEFKKRRQQRFASQRRSTREVLLDKKCEAILHRKMGNPTFWNFQFGPNLNRTPPPNPWSPGHDDEKQFTSFPPPPRSPSSNDEAGDVDSDDESMSDYSNLNAMGSADTVPPPSASPPHTQNPQSDDVDSSSPTDRGYPAFSADTRMDDILRSGGPSERGQSDSADEMDSTPSAEPTATESGGGGRGGAANENIKEQPAGDRSESAVNGQDLDMKDVEEPMISDGTDTDDVTENESKEQGEAQSAAAPVVSDIAAPRERAERQRSTRERKQCQEEMVRRRAAERIEEMRTEKAKEQNEDRMRHQIRERIHPVILRRAHPVRNNVVSLIALFYPKARLKRDATPKAVLKAFKRALANFHPDRTVNKPIEEQVEAEEIFKLLSREKEQYENAKRGKRPTANFKPYRQHTHHHRKRHGWF